MKRILCIHDRVWHSNHIGILDFCKFILEIKIRTKKINKKLFDKGKSVNNSKMIMKGWGMMKID